MTHKQEESRSEVSLRTLLFDKEGKPLRVLSTSLGIALLAHALLGGGAAVSASTEGDGAAGPKLLEWSTEEVKAFYDPSADWNLPLLEQEEETSSPAGSGASGSGSGMTGGTTIVHSGFGWSDLLLYHLIFNRGSAYSSSGWYAGNRAYDARTGSPYKPQKYSAESFQNKPVVGSKLQPKTVNSSGAITRRSTSSSKGGIGGKSSGFGSSGSSKSSGWFGG
ncbi:hypothetical protein [Paenibacillus sp. GCM10027626]|uniref:hypothetical protein n=1 Tax=Paenibacillus sp. GCM10027626 TaxID=3273411 RepID=UPI0036349158